MALGAQTADSGSLDGNTVEVLNADGSADIVLVCEHASNTVPAEFDGLGLDADALASHIAWDPGAYNVALTLSRILDAPLVAQRVSRLVYDCNRPPESDSAMPATSEIYEVPGNTALTEAQREARIETYYRPFEAALSELIASRVTGSRPPALVTIHSFTPVYHGVARAVEVGILHDEDTALADRLLHMMADNGQFHIARNEPYGPADGVTHTLKRHGVRNGLANAMIEIRNDLITDAESQTRMANWLGSCLAAVLPREVHNA